MKQVMAGIGEAYKTLDVDRLHSVHRQTVESGSLIGADRRSGLTTYNFDSCLRLAETGDQIRITFISLESGMQGADMYRRMFSAFLREYSAYYYVESLRDNTISFLRCEVTFLSYNRYNRIKDGMAEHYEILDV